MSRVIMTVTNAAGMAVDITQQEPGYGYGFGWSTGPGPNQDGCTGYDSPGEALDAYLNWVTRQ